MDSDKIKRWLNPICTNENCSTLDTKSVNQEWEPILRSSIPNENLPAKYFGVQSKKGFFFLGPAGTGKHQTAYAFAGSLKKSAGFSCFHIQNSILNLASEEEILEMVESLFNTASSDNVNTFCLIENPSKSDNTIHFLNMFMERWARIPSISNFILVVTDTDPTICNEDWQEFLLYCPFELPNMQERKSFFKNNQNGPLFQYNEEFSEEYLAKKTQDFNYNQLKTIVDLLRMKLHQRALAEYVDENGTVDKNALGGASKSKTFTVSADEIEWAIKQVNKARDSIVNNTQNTVFAVPALQGTNVYTDLKNPLNTYIPSQNKPEVDKNAEFRKNLKTPEEQKLFQKFDSDFLNSF